jgi:hypothetical protein
MSHSLFVGVGHDGLRIVSDDGKTWREQQIGKEGETYRAVACGDGRFVAVGSYGGGNIFATTCDGMAWQAAKNDGKYSRFVRAVIHGKGRFLAIGGDPGAVGDSKPFQLESTDGEKWSDFRDIAGKNILRRLAWGNERFVGVGDRGRRAVSKDGRDWQDAPEVKALDTLIDVAFGKEVFVGVGLHGLRMWSEEGLKWSPRLAGEEGEHLNSIVWTGERFVAVGVGATYISAGGKQWERVANKEAPLTVAYGNGVFVGVRWEGRVMRSTDGVQWQQVHKCDQHVEALAYGAI